MGLILKEIVERTYRADFCSCSTFLCSLFTLVIIIVPFFLAASTHGFWSSALEYYEQPLVLYRNELILGVLTSSKSISNNILITNLTSSFFSTLGQISELNSEKLIPVDIQSNYLDENADLKPDFYTFNLTLYESPKNIRNLKLFIQFDYRLRERVNLDMTCLAIVDIDLPNGASSVFVDGILRLKQRKPLKSSRVVRKVYNESLFSLDRPLDGFWTQLLRRYMNRNETTVYEYQTLSYAPGESYKTQVNLNIRVPVYQEVVYQPLFLQNLKFAWIQYLSLLIPIWFIVSSFSHYVFSQQIFETAVEVKKFKKID